MKKYLTLLFTLVLLAGISCTTTPDPEPKPDPEADKQALMKMSSEDWDANVLAGNMDANMDFIRGCCEDPGWDDLLRERGNPHLTDH